MSTERDGQLASPSPSPIALFPFVVLPTHSPLLAPRKLYRIESPFFDVTDVLNNGEMTPHYRSVVVFVRYTPNEA